MNCKTPAATPRATYVQLFPSLTASVGRGTCTQALKLLSSKQSATLAAAIGLKAPGPKPNSEGQWRGSRVVQVSEAVAEGQLPGMDPPGGRSTTTGTRPVPLLPASNPNKPFIITCSPAKAKPTTAPTRCPRPPHAGTPLHPPPAPNPQPPSQGAGLPPAATPQLPLKGGGCSALRGFPQPGPRPLHGAGLPPCRR